MQYNTQYDTQCDPRACFLFFFTLETMQYNTQYDTQCDIAPHQHMISEEHSMRKYYNMKKEKKKESMILRVHRVALEKRTWIYTTDIDIRASMIVYDHDAVPVRHALTYDIIALQHCQFALLA